VTSTVKPAAAVNLETFLVAGPLEKDRALLTSQVDVEHELAFLLQVERGHC
jgi:hypothetical protein